MNDYAPNHSISNLSRKLSSPPPPPAHRCHKTGYCCGVFHGDECGDGSGGAGEEPRISSLIRSVGGANLWGGGDLAPAPPLASSSEPWLAKPSALPLASPVCVCWSRGVKKGNGGGCLGLIARSSSPSRNLTFLSLKGGGKHINTAGGGALGSRPLFGERDLLCSHAGVRGGRQVQTLYLPALRPSSSVLFQRDCLAWD